MNDAPEKDDKYARESFSMRRMTPGQVRAISAVAIVVVVAAIVYAVA